MWDNNTVPAVQASENVWEFSAEVGVPILKDVPLVQSLSTDLAGRYTDYSISGSVETWKIGMDWHVNDDVRFRGTTSVDIRAPTLNDLFSPKVSNSGPFLDPLTNYNPGGIQTISGGNPDLKPEVSRTYTGGVVLTPTFIPGLTASVDYYQIKLKNAITSISRQQCGDCQSLCRIRRFVAILLAVCPAVPLHQHHAGQLSHAPQKREPQRGV